MDTPEGKRPPGRPVCRCEDNTEIEFWEVKWKSVDWIHVAEDMDRWRAVVNTVMNIPAGFIKCLTSWGTISFSISAHLRGVALSSPSMVWFVTVCVFACVVCVVCVCVWCVLCVVCVVCVVWCVCVVCGVCCVCVCCVCVCCVCCVVCGVYCVCLCVCCV
jgi:hypothetical protein